MENQLRVVEQKIVEFYDDELIAIRAESGQIYVSVRHLCSALGLDRTGQVRRIQRNEILAEGYQGGVIMSPPSASGRGGGPQQTGLLRVDLVPLWLSGIDTNRVKEELREKLKQYQRQAAQVLWDAFQEGRLTNDLLFNELLQQDTPEVQAYKMIQGMLQLARNQIVIRAQLQTQQTQLDDYGKRLEEIESQLGQPDRLITPAQATEISQAVKAVAMALSASSGRNEYGSIYGELYRRFEVPSYKQIPASRFQEVMDWLNEWLLTLTSDNPF